MFNVPLPLHIDNSQIFTVGDTAWTQGEINAKFLWSSMNFQVIFTFVIN